MAKAVKAEKLAFLTDVEGLYRDFEDKNSLISEMMVDEAQEFINSGSLGGGMLPKLQNCVDAIKEAFFHGRSLGALSVTGNDHYQEPFAPLLPGIRFGDFNDLNSVKALINDKTCAILMETIQGEGGIYPATEEFLKGVRKLCDEHDLLLILDEIQCGMGRSGSMFAWQAYDGVKPDVMTVAKALGNGVPIGAFLASGKAATAMQPGDHGTTYGGNLFVCAAADTVLEAT